MLRATVLTPAQQKAADGLLEGIAVGGVLLLRGPSGSGKTTILEMIHALRGGALIGARELAAAMASKDAGPIEEAFLRLIEDAMAAHELVIVDDLHLVTSVVEGPNYPNTYLLDAALTALLTEARANNRTVVFASRNRVPWSITRRAYVWEIGEFGEEDYAHICRARLSSAEGLDFGKIFRFAPGLNGHQLTNASTWLSREPALDTEGFLDYLSTHDMTSNVKIEEVQPVKWSDLKGVDDVIRVLEAKIALPFENDALAAQLQLKPKRGVLIAGPPGTGKTTIGRALAHRLKSKFFLIDGTVIAGSCDFYDNIKQVFETARRNAPSIVFIDDSDVIFEGGQDTGLYRYLLTMLDGLESATSERVCVMMTAMNPSSIPPAMLRSGRVELWIETRLPDASAREQILRDRVAGIEAFADADLAHVAGQSKGLTGADLKAVVEDAKLLFAHDLATGAPARAVEDYFIRAIEEVRANHRNYGRRRTGRFGETQKIGF
jgi:SpoVK/Ycf46/Vps4 family AAA+-type ATPase